MGETDWLALLRELDKTGGIMPRDFDRAEAAARLERLTELLSKAYDHELEIGHEQESTCYGYVRIPGELTRTRTKRTRTPAGLAVSVSYFGDLVSYDPAANRELTWYDRFFNFY